MVSLAASSLDCAPLTELSQDGARRLIEAVVSAEFEEYLSAFTLSFAVYRAKAPRKLRGIVHSALLLRCFACLVALTAGCAAKPDQAPMVLRCAGSAGTDESVVEAICDALAAELADLAPHRIVRRASGDDSSAFGVWEGVLEVVRTERSVWEARLAWGLVGSEGSGSVGPFVQIVSSDAALGSRAYRHFARSILKVSQPAL